MVKNLIAVHETQLQSLFQEESLEKEIPTPVFLPGEFHGQRSLAGYHAWSHKELIRVSKEMGIFSGQHPL